MKYLLVILISYLIGSFSSSYVLARKIKGIDIRDYGSGNAGSTNALRVLGKKYGGLTLIMDSLKGFLAVYIGWKILGYDGELLAGFFVVMGHNYSIFLNFKGGKGIATSIGVILAIEPLLGLVCILVGVLVVILTKYVSLGSIIGSLVAPIALNLIYRPVNKHLNIMVISLSLFALFRHRENIKRLIEGNENRLK